MKLPDTVSRFWTRSDNAEIETGREYFFAPGRTVMRVRHVSDGEVAFYDITEDFTFSVTANEARDMVQHSDLVPLEAK